MDQSAPKERRRHREGKRSSKRVLLERLFLLCSTVGREEKKWILQNTGLDDRFSARRLLCSFSAPPMDLGRNFLRGGGFVVQLLWEGGGGVKRELMFSEKNLSSKILWGGLLSWGL